MEISARNSLSIVQTDKNNANEKHASEAENVPDDMVHNCCGFSLIVDGILSAQNASAKQCGYNRCRPKPDAGHYT